MARTFVAYTDPQWRPCTSTWVEQMTYTMQYGGSMRAPGKVVPSPHPTTRPPMGEVRARIVSKAYPGVHTPAGVQHNLAWANDTVWLGGSHEDAAAIAGALPATEDVVAMRSAVSKMHVLRTWMEGQRIWYGTP